MSDADEESFAGSDLDSSFYSSGQLSVIQDDEDMPAEPTIVLKASEIYDSILSVISEVAELLDVRRSTAKAILKHFKWNKEDLITAFIQASKEQLFAIANIQYVRIVANYCVSPECEICLTASTALELVGPEKCNHRFCKACWKRYLHAQIFENAFDTISCAAHNCDALMEDIVVLQLIQEENIKERFKYLNTNAFVVSSRLLRWCPASDCMFIIKVTQTEPKAVLCKCGYEFCFGCGALWHQPISCSMVDKWKITLNDDALSNRWVQLNTQKCPNCKSNIQKISGCNHMICRSCNHEFCWICFSEWRGHSACNVWIPPKDEDHNILSAKRHAHYEKRYLNHAGSLKLEILLLDEVEKKEKDYEISVCDLGLYRCGINILHKSRQTLTATYIFAYFTKKCNQLKIFHHNQRDLEIATEELADYLDRQIYPEKHLYDEDAGTTSQDRPTLQDKYLYCDRRQQALLDHIHEGYEKAWWDTWE